MYRDDEYAAKSAAYVRGFDKGKPVDVWVPDRWQWWAFACAVPCLSFVFILTTFIVLVTHLPAATTQLGAATAVDPLAATIADLNRFIVETQVIDHTPVAAGEQRVFGHHLGPCRTSRALAIAHLALLETHAALAGRRAYYLGELPSVGSIDGDASLEVALSSAARDALIALYPSHATRVSAHFSGVLARDRRSASIGATIAAAVLANRSDDGSAHDEPHVGVDYPLSSVAGVWSPDPVSGNTVALGARWASSVRPFLMTSADQFRAAPPPALTSIDYAMAYDQVMSIGGNGIVTPTVRSHQETEMGLFWAYDGAAHVGVPPGLYNQIALVVAREFDAESLLRLLTALNVGMADAAIAAWDSKYEYRVWRPVVGIRRAAEDNNPMTMPIVDFTPLGAPASNSMGGTDFTPPFPAYPSGHATFGATLFETLRRALGRDNVEFSFVSTELNGQTKDSSDKLRPFSPHTFDSLSEAEESNGFSRMPLGIHWDFDKTSGIKMGRQVGELAARAFL